MQSVGILYVQENRCGAAAQRLWGLLTHAGELVIQHDHRIAYLDLGVHDSLPAWSRHANDFLGAEGFFVKLDRFIGALHGDVRCGSVPAVGYWFRHCFAPPVMELIRGADGLAVCPVRQQRAPAARWQTARPPAPRLASSYRLR